MPTDNLSFARGLINALLLSAIIWAVMITLIYFCI
jgi:hypothetical protein